jgi:hypothetical protein
MTSTVTYEITDDKIAIISPNEGPGIHYPVCQYVKRNLAAHNPLPMLFISGERARLNPAWNREPCQDHGRTS